MTLFEDQIPNKTINFNTDVDIRFSIFCFLFSGCIVIDKFVDLNINLCIFEENTNLAIGSCLNVSNLRSSLVSKCFAKSCFVYDDGISEYILGQFGYNALSKISNDENFVSDCSFNTCSPETCDRQRSTLEWIGNKCTLKGINFSYNHVTMQAACVIAYNQGIMEYTTFFQNYFQKWIFQVKYGYHRHESNQFILNNCFESWYLYSAASSNLIMDNCVFADVEEGFQIVANTGSIIFFNNSWFNKDFKKGNGVTITGNKMLRPPTLSHIRVRDYFIEIKKRSHINKSKQTVSCLVVSLSYFLNCRYAFF